MTASGPSLLLIGSGLSHLLLLLRARAQLGTDLQLTLVAPDRFALYPAMLPELISGRAGYRDCHVDLQQLCERAEARLVTSTLDSLDTEARCAYLSTGERVQFDLISLNGDIERAADKTPENPASSLTIKPIYRLLPGWQGMLERIYLHPKGASLALVGDDETSVELALAIRARLDSNPRLKKPAEVHLVHQGRSLLPHLPLTAQMEAGQMLQQRQIRVHPLFPALRLEEGRLLSKRGQHLPVDELIWCQPAEPQSRAQHMGLAVGEQGLIKINQHLQSVSHPFVFAAGDLTEFDAPSPAPAQAGAAYQAKLLVENLKRHLSSEALKAYKEPKKPLKFIKLDADQAIVLRGDRVLSGTWVRRWKNFIDRRFISQFPRP